MATVTDSLNEELLTFVTNLAISVTTAAVGINQYSPALFVDAISIMLNP